VSDAERFHGWARSRCLLRAVCVRTSPASVPIALAFALALLIVPLSASPSAGARLASPSRAGARSPEGHGAPTAVTARTVTFNIESNLHLIGRPGHVFNERGTFSGSQSGTIEIRFTSVTHTSGEATFAAYSSHGGSVSGHASTKGHVVGATVYFNGNLTVTGGTGQWAHASGRNLRFSGTVDRHTFNAKTHMQGSITV